MLGRTHAITGVAAALAVAAVTHTTASVPLAAYGLAAACALLPDLDQDQALATHIRGIAPLHFVLKRFRHRRFTHSLLGVTIFGAAMITLWSIIALFLLPLSFAYPLMAIAGYISHLVADSFNKQGIQLFYPFSPLGIEWWSVPLPRAIRISTIHDAKEGLAITPARIQALIHTEKWFFTYPVYALIGWLAWHQIDGLVIALKTDVWGLVNAAPAPVAQVLSSLLR